MTELLTYVVSGVVAGALYAMLAAGLVLTYQTSGIFNFAHGATAFVTAYLFLQLNTCLGWPAWLAGITSILVFAPLLGLVLDRILFRRLHDSPVVVKLVVPIALVVVLPAASLLVVDRSNAWFHTGFLRPDQVFAVTGLAPVPRQTWNWEGVVVNSDQLVSLGAAILTAIGFWVLLGHTRLGLRMRAVVDQRGLASLRGIDANLASATAWTISTGLAGLAGVLFAATFNTLNPPSFTTFVLVSTSAVVLARFGSIPVALLGGLGIGVLQNLIAGYADFARTITGFRTAVPFLVLFVLLFAVGAERTRTAGVASEDTAPASVARSSGTRSAIVWGGWAAILLVYVFVVANDFWQSLIARGLALSLVLLSFTIVTGLGGMVSLAQAAFVTVAGFASGWVISEGFPFGVALLAGTAIAACVGVVVSLPARRLGGLPLALATMALAFVGSQLLFQLDPLTNDGNGWRVTRPALGPVDLNDERSFIVVLLILVSVASWAIGNLTRSASGRAMVALRSTEPGAVTVGIQAARTKVTVFALSASVAGFGGVWLSAANGRVGTLDFPVEIGFLWLASAVVFGVRRPGGAVLAGTVGTVSPEVLSWISDGALLPQVIFGLAALNLAQNPDGILGIAAEHRHRRQQRRDRGAAEGGQRGTTVGTRRVDIDDQVEHPAEAVLAISGLRAGYGDSEVLHGVSLFIEAGEVLALIGANGAGKSTLCEAVAGSCAVKNGAILLDGRELGGLPAHERVGEGVFLIPEGRGIFPSLSVEENLAVWLPSSQDRDLAYRRFPSLDGRRQQIAGSLSGGEQQMLSLAPALARPPRLLIVDEPSLGLAPKIVEEVHAALKELRDAGVAILLVEEKANEVLSLADRIAFLSVGRIAWQLDAQEVDEELLLHSYLGLKLEQPL